MKWYWPVRVSLWNGRKSRSAYLRLWVPSKPALPCKRSVTIALCSQFAGTHIDAIMHIMKIQTAIMQ